MTARQEELTAGWLDGSLTPDEQSELLEALRADPDFARSFAEEVEVHRGLQFTAARSEAGDERAADRILHYVRAQQEATRFVEGVKLRALSGTRRRAGRRVHPGTSMVGPAIAAAAALFVAALVGLLAYVSHRQKLNNEPETAERHDLPSPPIPRDAAPETPSKAPVPEEQRQEQIDEDLRRAAETKKREAAPKPEPPKPVAPAPEPRVAENTPEPPAKPAPTAVEALPALAKLEKLQGEATANGEKIAAGAELRDDLVIEAPGLATVKFADGTTLELSGEMRLHERMTGKRASGKGVTLTRGIVSADVAKQPAGQAFLFTTAHAEVQVVGTRLSVQTGAETRVDVQEGQVRVMSLKGGQVVTLAPGQAVELAANGVPHGYLSGLRAVYYDLNTFKGQTLERTDRGIDLFLDETKNELPPVGTDRNFGVRWEGRFLAELEGDYVFFLSIDGRVRFVFDGQELVADKKDVFHPIQRSVIRRRLTAGWHEVLVEYGDDQGNSKCVLRYVPPDLKVPEGENFQRDDAGWAIPARLFSHVRR